MRNLLNKILTSDDTYDALCRLVRRTLPIILAGATSFFALIGKPELSELLAIATAIIWGAIEKLLKLAREIYNSKEFKELIK